MELYGCGSPHDSQNFVLNGTQWTWAGDQAPDGSAETLCATACDTP
jgi:hypothetical protein